LWIIQKPSAMVEQADKAGPGCGALMVRRPNEPEDVPLPLEHTDVDAHISGYIATVNVTQRYHNPYDGKIEAVYVFPLPQNAAVNEFIMTIGERRIRGIIREREEAQKIYAQALAAGFVASLLTQERPNIFTQKVGNIEPGKRIEVKIKYFSTLAYVDGWYEFVFPMVVGPRFNPPGSTDGVAAVSAGAGGRSGQKTEVQYLKPHERSGHDIALAVEIDAGVEIEDVRSYSHIVALNRPTPETVNVKLNESDSIPNKDFVLRYKVAGDTVKTALLTHRDQRGGFFTLMVYPPEDLHALDRAPLEMVFVIDCSGSMNGKPIALAKSAVVRALQSLRPGDTFQVIRFSQSASKFGRQPVEATPKNVRKALRYVRALDGGGGTMMIEGIRAALDFPHDPERFRFVCFLTDGYIGNEADILSEVRDRLGESRIFSFGIGSSPNRYLLERMAKLGRGAVAYVGLNDSATQVMDQLLARISHPALKDIEVDWGRMHVAEVFPRTIPDLFIGRPVILTGRFDGAPAASVRLSGAAGGEQLEIPIPIAASGETHDGLPLVWARMKIADLYARTINEDPGELVQLVKQTALQYGLMSAYTAFVAVDSMTRTTGDHGTTVAVPVRVPTGVQYKTTVDNP
jgi:Ca-activated chloride channel family protein